MSDVPVVGNRRDSTFSLRGPLTLTFSVSVVIQAANAATGILLARTLGLHDRGVLAAVILWPSLLAAIGCLGLPEAVTYYVARARSSGGGLFGTTLALTAMQSVAVVLVGVLLIPLVLGHFGSDAVRLALLYLAFVPLNLFALALMGYINGLHRFTAFNVLRATFILLSAVAIAVLAAAGLLTPTTAVASYLGAIAITLVSAAVFLTRAAELDFAVSRSAARDFLTFGLKSQTSNVSSILNERLDQLVISAVLAPAALGLYVVAVTLTSVIGLVGASVAIVALPVLAGLRSAKVQLAPSRRLIVLTLSVSAVVATPMILFAPQLLDFLFGHSFRAAEGPARILLLAAVLLSTGRAIGSILKALGRPLQAGLADAIALGVTVTALAALLPVFGLVGAAAASLLAYGVSLAWMIARVAHALEVRRWVLFLPTGMVRNSTNAPVRPAADGREGV